MSQITDTSPPTQQPPDLDEDTQPRTQWLPNPNTGDLEPFVDGKPVAWAPMPGSQVAFLSCPVFEVLLHGNRGPGKTCSALMDFAQHVGKGYGRAWQGLVFRRTYPELEDIVNQAKQWYPRIWPNSRFHETKHAWEWETGEVLSFRHADRDSDYWKMHGCVDEGEVLTKSGWRDIREIVVGDTVLSVDAGGALVERPVSAVFVKEYSGPLHRYAGRGRYMSFTPEHRLAVAGLGLRRSKRNSQKHHDLIPYRDLPSQFRLRTAGWRFSTTSGGVLVPESLEGTDPGDYCEILGWWLAEGHVRKDERRNECIIYQLRSANPEKWERIRALLQRTPSTAHVGVFDDRFSWSSAAWATHLRQFGGALDKWIPREVIESANTEQLQRLVDAMIDGDGFRDGTRTEVSTISYRLACNVEEIAARLGLSSYTKKQNIRQEPYQHGDKSIRSRHAIYRVRMNPRTETGIAKQKQIQTTHFDGRVYCIEVQGTENFLLKQRGYTWLSGNSNRPWILWEELTTWPNLNLYHMMMSICRAPVKEMPRKYRATTNPFGVGHNAVKKRFHLGLTDAEKKLPVKPKPPMVGPIIRETLKDGTSTERVAIRGDIAENKILLHSDPGYVARLTQAAPNPAALLAWLEGDWDVVAGGLLDDVWVPSVHVIPDIPGECIPKSWRIARAYDHGQSRPFAVQWWACSDGTPATFTSPVLTENGVEYLMQTVGQVAGDEILLNEWYGARKDEKGQTMPNAGLNLDAGSEIAPGIRDREERYFARYGLHVHPGPADSAIFDDSSPGKSVAADMRRAPGRITWTRADKRPGSRIQGVQQIRRLLKGSLNIRQSDDPTAPAGKDIVVVGPRTTPGMFICQNNVEWLRTVPVLPRDPKQPDDADTNAEDHCLVGDTLVQTTLGPRRLAELVGTEGFVYGHDGRPHRYRNCRLTRRAAPIVRLEFEDGTSIECTPDHKIMLEDLSWKRADALRSSDRVCSVLQFRISLHEPVAPSAVVPWGTADVYCMEVEDVHNFVVQGGIVVHNCFDTTRYYTRRASSVIRQEKF